MKIRLKEEIKGKHYKAGDIVIVRQDYGERLISKGIANRIIGEVDNRITVASDNRGRRFHDKAFIEYTYVDRHATGSRQEC